MPDGNVPYMTIRGPEADETQGPTALLWDLDNVAPPREHLASFARALCCLVEPDESVISAGHRVNFRSSRALLTDLGFQVRSGGRRRNGADRVLLWEAHRLAEEGVKRFLVVSHDHRFARIATFGDLHVISLTGENVSTALRAVARSIWVMSLNEGGWMRDCSRASGSVAGRDERRLAAEAPA